MERTSIDAIYENGLFRPIQPLNVPLPEGEQVRLQIEEARAGTVLEEACHIYDGLSAEEIADIERIGLSRGDFFEADASTL